jgi:hypothetical protein
LDYKLKKLSKKNNLQWFHEVWSNVVNKNKKSRGKCNFKFLKKKEIKQIKGTHKTKRPRCCNKTQLEEEVHCKELKGRDAAIESGLKKKLIVKKQDS